jgi:pimeloyl-ACP methyl ester carboxylesterase
MIDHIRELTTGDNAKIFYRVLRGKAPKRVLVLLHGMASNLTRWSEFVEQTALKESWDLLRPDLRGNGRSIFRGGITGETWCDDLVAMLDAEGYSHAVLVGHCLGANLAIRFATRHPDRTAGLVLVEPLLPETFVGALKKIQPYTALLNVLIHCIQFLNRLGLYRRHFPLLDLRKLDQETRTLMASTGSPDALVKRYLSLRLDLRYMPTAAYFQSLRELLRPLPSLENSPVSKLVLFSGGRLFCDQEAAQKRCASLPNSATRVLDSHHWIPTEKPVDMREAIERWCQDRFPSMTKGEN